MCKFFQMFMWNISHGCVEHYICCVGLRGHRCNTQANACEEVSRGLARLPAGEDAPAVLCLVWADSHLEWGCDERARCNTVWDDSTFLLDEKKGKKVEKKNTCTAELGGCALKSHRRAIQRGSTFTHAHTTQTYRSMYHLFPKQFNRFFIVGEQKKTHSQKERDKHCQAEGENRPNSQQTHWVCR